MSLEDPQVGDTVRLCCQGIWEHSDEFDDDFCPPWCRRNHILTVEVKGKGDPMTADREEQDA